MAKMRFSQKPTFAMSIRDQPGPKNAKHEQPAHFRWHDLRRKSPITSTLCPDFSTNWRPKTLFSAQNDDSRVPCALILAQIGDRKRYLEPKMAIHELI